MEGKRIGRKGRSCRSGPAARMDGSKDREESKRASGGREGRGAGKSGEGEKKQGNSETEEGRKRKSRQESSGWSLCY